VSVSPIDKIVASTLILGILIFTGTPKRVSLGVILSMIGFKLFVIIWDFGVFVMIFLGLEIITVTKRTITILVVRNVFFEMFFMNVIYNLKSHTNTGVAFQEE
jgi:hypothetical protein